MHQARARGLIQAWKIYFTACNVIHGKCKSVGFGDGGTRSLNVDVFHLLPDTETSARMHVFFANKSGRKKFPTKNRFPPPFLRTYKFPLYPFPILPSLFIFFLSFPSLFSFFSVLICQLHWNTRGRRGRGGGAKDGQSRRIWPRPVPFEIQMDDGKAKRENRGGGGIHLRRLCRRCELFA